MCLKYCVERWFPLEDLEVETNIELFFNIVWECEDLGQVYNGPILIKETDGFIWVGRFEGPVALLPTHIPHLLLRKTNPFELWELLKQKSWGIITEGVVKLHHPWNAKLLKRHLEVEDWFHYVETDRIMKLNSSRNPEWWYSATSGMLVPMWQLEKLLRRRMDGLD